MAGSGLRRARASSTATGMHPGGQVMLPSFRPADGRAWQDRHIEPAGIHQVGWAPDPVRPRSASSSMTAVRACACSAAWTRLATACRTLWVVIQPWRCCPSSARTGNPSRPYRSSWRSVWVSDSLANRNCGWRWPVTRRAGSRGLLTGFLASGGWRLGGQRHRERAHGVGGGQVLERVGGGVRSMSVPRRSSLVV